MGKWSTFQYGVALTHDKIEDDSGEAMTKMSRLV